MIGALISFFFYSVLQFEINNFQILVLHTLLAVQLTFIFCIFLGIIFIGGMVLAVLEPSLPVWMNNTMHAHQWEQGM